MNLQIVVMNVSTASWLFRFMWLFSMKNACQDHQRIQEADFFSSPHAFAYDEITI